MRTFHQIFYHHHHHHHHRWKWHPRSTSWISWGWGTVYQLLFRIEHILFTCDWNKVTAHFDQFTWSFRPKSKFETMNDQVNEVAECEWLRKHDFYYSIHSIFYNFACVSTCYCDFNHCILFNSFCTNNFTCVSTHYCDFNYWKSIKKRIHSICKSKILH